MQDLNSLLKYHISQFDLGLPKTVERCCCGIASAVCALKWLKADEETSNNELAIDLIASGRYTLPRIGATFDNYAGHTFPVLLSRSTNQNDLAEALERARVFLTVYSKGLEHNPYTLKIITTDDSEYHPTFLMKSGTDVRGLARWLENKGLKTEIHEYRDQSPSIQLAKNHKITTCEDGFIEAFMNALSCNDALVITSVTKSKFNYAVNTDVVRNDNFTETHVVVAKKSLTDNYVVCLDPAHKDGSLGVKLMETQVFLDALTNTNKKGGHFITVWNN